MVFSFKEVHGISFSIWVRIFHLEDEHRPEWFLTMSRVSFCGFVLVSHAIYCYFFHTIWIPIVQAIHEDYGSDTNNFCEVKMRSHRKWIWETAEIVRMIAAELRLRDRVDKWLLWWVLSVFDEAKHHWRHRWKKVDDYSGEIEQTIFGYCYHSLENLESNIIHRIIQANQIASVRLRQILRNFWHKTAVFHIDADSSSRPRHF